MKSLEQELAAVDKEAAEKRQGLEFKHKVLALLPLGDYAPPFVHVHKLYGSAGSLNFNIQRFSSIAEGKSPDTELLRRLLATLPPVDLILIRKGCTSIQPEPESYENNGEAVEIDPVFVRIEPSSHTYSSSVEWYGQLERQVWRVKVDFPIHQPKLGSLRISYDTTSYGNESKYISSCEFLPKPQGANRIRWSSGDRQTPNSFTVYWERGHNTDIPALFE